jgi:CSLREA domain-containing protein
MNHNVFTQRLIEEPQRLITALLLIGLALALTPLGAVRADGFPVNTTADTVDVIPGDGVCADSSDNCSLRAAIGEANALVGADTITLPAGTYTLTIGGTGEDANATGDLDITDDLTIYGADEDTTIIDAAQIDRALQITDTVTVIIDEVTFRNGRSPSGDAGSGGPGGDGENGGGILNAGNLNLSSCTVVSNTAGNGGGGEYGSGGTTGTNGGTGGAGGGIYSSGTLSLTLSTVVSNTAGDGGAGGNADVTGGGGGTGGRGGGIYSSGPVTLTLSSVVSNTAGSGGAGGDGGTAGGDAGNGGHGGGIHNSATLTARRSRILDNRAGGGGVGGEGSPAPGGDGGHGGHGGGIYNDDGSIELTRCTVAGNTAGPGNDAGSGNGSGGAGGLGGSGGGIHSRKDGTVLVTNSTISGNATGGGGDGGDGYGGGGNQGGDGGEGGGIYLGGGTVELTNGTVASNTTSGGGLGGTPSGSDGSGGDGGGLRVSSGSARLKNSILAVNSAAGSGPDCSGTVSSRDHNLVRDTSGCTIGGTTTHDITGQDPLLDPLALNPPGETETHALRTGSPAIDVIPPISCTVAIDQRGVVRPQGNECDIGAYELLGGTVTIIKDLVPDDGSQWDFALSGPTPGTRDALGDGEFHAFSALAPGFYNVGETSRPGYATAVDCGPKGSDDDDDIFFHLDLGEQVTCTFTNTMRLERGTIILRKATHPAGGAGFSFIHDIEADGSFILNDGTREVFYSVSPGTYTVTEDDPSPGGYELTGLACVEDGTGNSATDSNSRQANITLDAAETVTCTFTDTLQTGTIQVCKDVEPDDASQWHFALNGPTPGSSDSLGDGGCHTFDGILPGFYTLSEAPEDDYASSIDCGPKGSDDDHDISFSLDPGEDVSCTFTNTLQALEPGTIVVEKKIEGGACSGSYTFEIPNLLPGSYPVTEDSPTLGSSLATITCDDGGSATPSTWNVGSRTAFFELDPGETATCSFTNRLLVAVTGGAVLPTDRLALLAPWLGLGALVSLGAIGVVMVRRRGG